jgi:hypothetical protein
MSDLRSQLATQFGLDPAVNVEPVPASAGDDPLGSSAHLGTPWLDALLLAVRQERGMDVPKQPSLNAAKQLHDRLKKRLKADGRRRQIRTLDDLRSSYLKRREKQAWSRLKAGLAAMGTSEKLYRSLKQSGGDPERVLQRLKRLKPDEISGQAQAKLRELLLKK